LVPLGLSPSESGFWKGDTHMPAISKNEMGSGRHREKRKSANVYLTQTKQNSIFKIFYICVIMESSICERGEAGG
ncbi:MAG: hypothetical protein IIT46_09350, partial [Lachnospiraceae bacterium]|nr:hypothetical protein [Lachnospiraceae bacterium]